MLVGSNEKEVEAATACGLVRLVVLFCREKEIWPAGILPRAFSDMPRSCVGRGSSVNEETEGVLELCIEGEDCRGVGSSSLSSSESSSSPMAKAPSSSGTLLSFGDLAPCGLRVLSIELARLR